MPTAPSGTAGNPTTAPAPDADPAGVTVVGRSTVVDEVVGGVTVGAAPVVGMVGAGVEVVFEHDTVPLELSTADQDICPVRHLTASVCPDLSVVIVEAPKAPAAVMRVPQANAVPTMTRWDFRQRITGCVSSRGGSGSGLEVDLMCILSQPWCPMTNSPLILRGGTALGHPVG